ncbi:MAG: 3'-5' exonuclease [Desulfitobacteriaceae bacterium]|nr:3'-5' exonuclease [Desulfitobacteriaceae bacterium]
MQNKILVLDLETTNNPDKNYRHEIIEIAVIAIVDGSVEESNMFHTLVRPPCRIQPRNFSVSGISDLMVEKAPTIIQVLPDLLDFLKDYPIVGHNISSFDSKVLNEQLREKGFDELQNAFIDTLLLSKKLFKGEKTHNLDALMSRLGIALDKNQQRHRAAEDVKYNALAFLKITEILQEKGITTFEDILKFCNKDSASSGGKQTTLF